MEAEIVHRVVVHWLLAKAGLFADLSTIALLKSIQVNTNGLVTIDRGVFRLRIWLIEIICIINERRSNIIKDDRGIGAKQHSNAASTAGRSCRTLGVDSNISTDHETITTIV